MDLKDTWKDVGKGLGFAFRDLGKAVIKSAKTGIDEMNNWANPPKEKLPEPETAETAEIPEGETAKIPEGETVEASETAEIPETADAVDTDSGEKTDDNVAPPKAEERKPRFTHDHIDDDD